MALVPVYTGADQLTVAWALPWMAVTLVGGSAVPHVMTSTPLAVLT
jgi:hypothetical protein